jgi:hypothetical protein
MSRILLVTLLSGVLLLIGCEKKITTEDESRITYFPEFNIVGDEYVTMPKDSKYVDEGAVSTENGIEIETSVTSNVDTSEVGIYTVNYSATNSEGYSKTATRHVIVYDPDKGVGAADISGSYLSNVVQNNTQAYTNLQTTLTKVAEGVFFHSDWVGGYYAQGKKGGATYAFKGYMLLTANNEIIHLSSTNPWGIPFNDVIGIYEPQSKQLDYKVIWMPGSYEFTLDMTLIE